MAFTALLLPVTGYDFVPPPKPRAEGDPPPNNTGEYNGWNIRVKGDGRVEATDPATGIATMHHDVIEAKHSIDTYGVPGGRRAVYPGPQTESATSTRSTSPSGEAGA